MAVFSTQANAATREAIIVTKEAYTVRFLAGPDILSEIRRIAQSSPTLDMAVAYWGWTASQMLGLRSRHQLGPTRILCDLLSGGTNPAEIRSILSDVGKVEIKHFAGLHAKVYLGEGDALVGSANASTNGLQIEGEAALKGLEEAAFITNDELCLKTVKTWFESLWSDPRSTFIRSDSHWLAVAELAYARIRKTNTNRDYSKEKSVTLREVLRNSPALLRECSVYATWWDEWLSKEAERETEARIKRNDALRGFAVYEEDVVTVKKYPLNSYLIDGRRVPSTNRIILDGGFWRVRDWKQADRWIVQPFRRGRMKRFRKLIWVDRHQKVPLPDLRTLVLDRQDRQLLRMMMERRAAFVDSDETIHLYALYQWSIENVEFSRSLARAIR